MCILLHQVKLCILLGQVKLCKNLGQVKDVHYIRSGKSE